MTMPKINFRKILPILKLGTKLVDKIPTREDSWPERITKALAMFDAMNEVYGPGRSKLREMKDRYGLVERESETFVRLFFATTIRDLFQLKRIPLDEHEELIEAVGADGERILFRESHWSTARIENEFYISPEVDLRRVIDRLWAQYQDGIYLSITSDQGGWRKETTICDVPPVYEDRLSKHARDRLASSVATHRRFAEDGVPRTYLLLGPTGTGKTTFGTLFARALGGRALKLDATSLPLLSVKEIGFLIDTLAPNFLFLDDVDRAPIGDVGPRVLFLLERLKSHYPSLTIVMSVNDPKKLDSAILRCGRIDVPIEFPRPEREEVRQMVTQLLQEHDVPKSRTTRKAIENIVSEAVDKHLTHAYLDDLCRRLRHEELADVLSSVSLLRKLAEDSEQGGEAKPGAPPQPMTKAA